MGIVERLRLVAAWHTPGGPTPKEPRGRIDNVCLAAIAKIERQANLIERLKGYARHERGCDAVEAWNKSETPVEAAKTAGSLSRFIITKPDPLVEIIGLDGDQILEASKKQITGVLYDFAKAQGIRLKLERIEHE